jgi:hypothetical protein
MPCQNKTSLLYFYPVWFNTNNPFVFKALKNLQLITGGLTLYESRFSPLFTRLHVYRSHFSPLFTRLHVYTSHLSQLDSTFISHLVTGQRQRHQGAVHTKALSVKLYMSILLQKVSEEIISTQISNSTYRKPLWKFLYFCYKFYNSNQATYISHVYNTLI